MTKIIIRNTNPSLFKSNLFSFSSLKSFFLIYAFVIFALPNDVFQATSILTFLTPSSVSYIWYDIYISYLYLPIIAFSLISFVFNHKKERNHHLFGFLFALIFLCFLKDIIFLLFNKQAIFDFSFEYYFELGISISILYLFYINSKNTHQFVTLFILFCLENIIMLLFGVLFSFSAKNGEYAYRYTSPNLNQNSTGLLFLYAIMLITIKKYKHGLFFDMVFFIGILLTGNRSSMLLVIVFWVIYFIKHISVLLKFFSNFKNQVALIFILLFLFSVFQFNLFSNFNNRFQEMIQGILSKGIFKYFLTDSTSGSSRIIGLKQGLIILKKYFWFGSGFSLYSFQYIWTICHGVSAFPHFQWICDWMLLGFLYVPFFLYIFFSTIKLTKRKDSMCLFGWIILLHMFVDGGMYQNEKHLFFIIYSYLIIVWSSKEKYGCLYNHC